MPSQGLRAALFLAWAGWAAATWLASGELSRSLDTWRLAGNLLPPWPALSEAVGRAVNAFAGALLVVGAAFSAGKCAVRLLAASRRAPRHPGFLVTSAAGIPVLALLVEGLGLAGLLYRGILGAALLALLIALFAGRSRRPGRPAKPRPRRGKLEPEVVALLGVSALAALVVVAGALAPATAWDEFVYHLRVPALYLMAHKVYPVPEIFHSYFPFNGEMLFLAASVAGGDAAAKLVHAACWLGTAAVVAKLADVAWGRGAAAAALALFTTIPLGMNIATRAYADFSAIFPFMAGLLILFPALMRGARPVPVCKAGYGPRAVVLAGWLAGTAAGTKYLGGFLAATLMVLAVAGARRRRRPGAAVFFLLATLGAGGAWYARNLLWVGNPFYPLLFGGPHWTPLDAEGFRADAPALSFNPLILLGAPGALLSGFQIDGGLSPLLFAAAAVPLLWPKRAVGGFWGLAAALVLAWWLTPLSRYMLPALAVMCVAAAGSAAGRGPRLAVLAMSLALVPCGLKAIAANSNPYGVAMGHVSGADFRRDQLGLPGYAESLDTLERIMPPDGRAYVMGHVFAYGLPRRAWFDSLYLRPPLYWLVTGAESPDRVAVRARQAALTHLACNPRGGRGILGDKPHLMEWKPEELKAWMGFWETRVEMAARAGVITIYRVNPHPGKHPLPRGYLPGTENITAPIDILLRGGKAEEAERACLDALARYPFFPYLTERLARARGMRGAR